MRKSVITNSGFRHCVIAWTMCMNLGGGASEAALWRSASTVSPPHQLTPSFREDLSQSALSAPLGCRHQTLPSSPRPCSLPRPGILLLPTRCPLTLFPISICPLGSLYSITRASPTRTWTQFPHDLSQYLHLPPHQLLVSWSVSVPEGSPQDICYLFPVFPSVYLPPVSCWLFLSAPRSDYPPVCL